MNILYSMGYPHRMAGSQKQLEQLIVNLPKSHSCKLHLTLDLGVAKYFRENNITVDVIAPKGYLNLYGKQIEDIKDIKDYASILFNFIRFSFTMSKYFRKNSFDLVHCNDVRALLLLSLACFMSRRKIVLHLQGENAISNKYLWKLVELIPNKIIANADFVQNNLSTAAKRKCSVIHTGLEDIKSRFNHTKIEQVYLNRFQNNVVISCFASIVPFKGYHHLIEAINILVKDKTVNKSFIVVGLGDYVQEYDWYQKYIIEKIDEYNIKDRIILTGWTDNPLSFLRHTDICTLPSVRSEVLAINDEKYVISGNEGFPTTHLEAMMFGKPIVGTDIAGVSEQIIHAYNGFLVEPSNAIQLADSLKKLILDVELRERMGLQSREFFESKFALEKFINRCLMTYDTL